MQRKKTILRYSFSKFQKKFNFKNTKKYRYPRTEISVLDTYISLSIVGFKRRKNKSLKKQSVYWFLSKQCWRFSVPVNPCRNKMALLFVSWNLTAYEDTCFGVYCSHVYSVFYDRIWLAMLSHLCFLFHSTLW